MSSAVAVTPQFHVPDGLTSVHEYAAAKSRQDVIGALAHVTDDFVLETPAFGTTARGCTEAEEDLALFFELFPDYEFAMQGAAQDGDQITAWGYARMTWSGRLPAEYGWLHRLVRLRPRRIEFFASAVFDIRDGKLARERFLFDLDVVARGLGLPRAVVRFIAGTRSRVRARAGEMRIEHGMFIDAPAAYVFDRGFRDVSALLGGNLRFPVHATDITLEDGPFATGATRRVTLSSGHVMIERIERCDADRRIDYRIENGFGRPFDWLVQDGSGVHELEIVGDRTYVSWRARARPRSRWTAPLGRFIFKRVVGTVMARFHRSLGEKFRG